MGEGEVRVPWNVGVCAPGAGTGAGLCCSSLRSATQHSNAYQWWCGFRNYHLPPLLDHAHAPYFFSTQLLARNLASFCSLSLLLLPHLWTVVGTRARAGSWSLSSTRTRQPSPPSTVPALRSLRLCPRCLVAWLLGCLLPCLLGVAPALHRHHCPVCDRSSRHPSTHPSLGHPSLILASPPDNSVRRNRVSSVLISAFASFAFFAFLPSTFLVLQSSSPFSTARACCLPWSSCHHRLAVALLISNTHIDASSIKTDGAPEHSRPG